MAKSKKIWLAAAIAAAALVVCAAVLLFVPFHQARNRMPAGAELTLTEQKDGSLLLSWPKSEQAQYYRVQLLRSGEDGKQTVLQEHRVQTNACTLKAFPTDGEVTVRVDSVVEFSLFGKTRPRYGQNPIKAVTTLAAPEVSDLQWTVDTQTKTVAVTYGLGQEDSCRCTIRQPSGAERVYAALTEGRMAVSFGTDLRMPGHGETVAFILEPFRKGNGFTYYGNQTAEFSVGREDLLGRDLQVEFTELENNRCALTWNETKGDCYQVQYQLETGEDWVTMAQIAADEERVYTSPRLAPCEQYRFRVVALGGQTMEGSETAAVSSVFELATQESPIYATVWPVTDLDAYADKKRTEVVGKALCARAYCVVEEQEGLFGIMLDGKLCYIESNHCMINLPEYLGRLCSYDITNSYQSLYMVHEFEIPNVTGQVTGGYEYVKLADGQYLVPLLYPTAQRLAVAAKAAVKEGYRLKIYDSFRPNRATVEIYNRTEAILEDPIPERTYTGRWVSLPEDEDGMLTYYDVMTGGQYGLNSFLAKGASRHNLGVALDMTIEDAQTGEELQMQSSMHDLSFYSVVWKNNAAANVLATIMKDAGFVMIGSEWWHFQDDEIAKTQALHVVWGGIAAQCWMHDGVGWKYRKLDGSYYTNCTATIEEKEYSFDQEGYVLGQ